ncbi:MAG: 3-methyl-2-oxobutanoate hydroxymethyltransferase [Gemmatimonadetes bacterium]|nr:3-methyl-2-oxobutanoate hydroxymethyltransferase [Gemmatimonadota bacterium]
MKRRGEKIVALTAYDFLFARLVDSCGVDIILVGDSLGQVVAGYDTTLPVTLDDMIYHARAVRRGVRHGLIVVDMPFLSFHISPEETIRNAGRVLKETGAEAVKIEGGHDEAVRHVRALTTAGMAVMGHIGLTPQAVHAIGGYRVQGREEESAARMEAEAKQLEAAGAFALVVELTPADLARTISQRLTIPTIGIGAGPGTDGQVLVLYDVLGLNESFTPKFLQRFANLADSAREGIRAYADAVRTGRYPDSAHSFE